MAQSDDWKVVQKPKERMSQGAATINAAPQTSATPKGKGPREGFGDDMLNLKPFKKGGKVKKTGPAKVHKGEFVVKKSAAKKIGAKKLNKMNRESADVRLLKRARA